jgi:ribosome-associated toxin RatA of RatAB toxin-antitoxin module
MAERRFSAEIVVGRDPEDVFEWVADYRHVSQALEGVSRWQPLQERTRGKGARFDVSMSALGFPLDNVLVLDEWKQASAIGWRSESGLVRQTGRWRFDPDAAGTRVSLSIGYVAREVETLVTARLQRALARMKEILEAEVRRAG